MIWLLRIKGALTAPKFMALVAPVEEPSTASYPDIRGGQRAPSVGNEARFPSLDNTLRLR
jgi:hypothetical protein